VALLSGSQAGASPITYAVSLYEPNSAPNSTNGIVSVAGSITTDGTLGTFYGSFPNHIIDWDLIAIVSQGQGQGYYHEFLGPLSGADGSVVSVSWITATPLTLALNYTNPTVSAFLVSDPNSYWNIRIADANNSYSFCSVDSGPCLSINSGITPRGYGSFTGPVFADGKEVPSTVPLPAALPLFATGLGALGLLGWRRKRKGAAIAA